MRRLCLRPVHNGHGSNSIGRESARSRLPRWIWLGSTALAGLLAGIAAIEAQQLPPGGGPLPELRRGAKGEIEVVPPAPAARPERSQRSAAPAPQTVPPRAVPRDEIPAARAAPPLRPVIMVAPILHIPDTTPRGAVVTNYSVRMSNGSPFTGTVRFGPPHYDGGGVFALAGDKIIINPDGPGIGHNRTTITKHITLEAITTP